MKNTPYQPKTGQPCSCKPGQQRDNCPQCEGTGMRIDFKAIRERSLCCEEDHPDNSASVRALAEAEENMPSLD